METIHSIRNLKPSKTRTPYPKRFRARIVDLLEKNDAVEVALADKTVVIKGIYDTGCR